MTTENTSDLFSTTSDLDNDYEVSGATGTEDLVNNLVGEGKKYKSVNDLAYSKVAADAHIRKVQDENKALREALQRQQALEDLLKQVREPSPVAPNVTSNPAHNSGDESGAPSLDDIEAKVLKRLEERTQKEREARNMELVKSTVQDVFGPNFGTELKARLAETDLSEVEADRLAKNNPKAFFRLLGIDSQAPAQRSVFTPAAPQTKVNTMATQKLGSPERTKSYYDNIKAKMGVKAFYQDRNLQTEIHNQALRLGERFFDT